MLRKLLISYFILAVLSIVSANSCEDKSEIKFQKPYYLRFNKGFFYVHGLTNGESVVIYKLPSENENLIVHLTFLTSNCRYKTYYYQLSSNGKYVIEEPSLNTVEDFEIDSKLVFILDGVNKLINYKITVKNGYSVYTDIEPSESINLESLLSIPINESSFHQDHDKISDSLTLDSDKLQWTTMNDSFYQIYNRENILNGQYTLRTSDEKYHTINYTILPFKRNLTTHNDQGKSDFNNEDKYNTDKPAFNLNSYRVSDEKHD